MIHHETIGEGGRAIVFLHGFLGRGRNWTTIARRFVAARPGWRAVLPDLRLHGESRALAPPHTVASCADDVRELAAAVGPVGALVGHSFGGKVALAARELAPAIFVVDADPSAMPPRTESDSGLAVIALLRTMPRPGSRAAATAALEKAGLSREMAGWLAMNLDPSTGSWRLDLDGLETMLRDWYRTDSWSAVGPGVHLVVGSRSADVAPASAARAASQGAMVHRVLAGHWVHVDAPDALVDLLVGRA